MNFPDLVSAAEDARALAELNQRLDALPAEERVAWALATLPQSRALSSSFGAQSAAALHLITRQTPDIPVILVDTGYLFAETYRFADELAQRLQLNLKVYRPNISRAWMEARHGRLWENGVEGLDQYNALRKVEPMRRALDELAVRTWFAGLRRAQARTRHDAQVLELRNGRWKFQPLVDWSDRDIYLYLQRFDLPYHPLWDEGYVSIGDTHTTARWEPGMLEEDTRFFGLKRECGIHVDL
ncbi:phosphoadenylyl-sulfate reductase [Tahibacter sp. UC22_41]|uniref:phosphoadenylyl-sulfate reductase n=1 Tax=Tahibacter sp. UC22_41 TaxID=3350178 RepID=UPI002B93FAC0|nr:phosphoadenylyl-sulfate reductase [Tahibacter sp.]